MAVKRRSLADARNQFPDIQPIASHFILRAIFMKLLFLIQYKHT
jgi:hypothetical protein